MWRQDPLGRAMQIASGAWQDALSNAWRRARIGGAERKSKRRQARSLHQSRDGKAEVSPSLSTGLEETFAKHQVIRSEISMDISTTVAGGPGTP